MRAAIIVAMLAMAGATIGGAHAQACPPTGGFESASAVATSERELRLADGRIVRLAGVVAPEGAEPDARAGLARLLEGRAIRFAPVQTAPDRYGRIVARVVAGEGWIEAEMARAGLLLADPHPGETGCIGALLQAEAEARRARRGVWAVEAGPVLDLAAVGDASVFSGRQGRFLMVEGRPVSVGVRDYATFLNFGRRWTENLTVVIARADRARVEAVHGPSAALRGRSLRIRGVVEPGASPRMAVSIPEAIEVLD